MKKIVLSFLFLVIFIPFIVNAETCETDKITIESITLNNKSDNVKELSETFANGKDINLNLSMTEVGDEAVYKIIIKNSTNEDYSLNSKDLNTDSDYITYSFDSDNNSILIKANSSKEVNLRVQYKKEIPETDFENNIFNHNKTISVTLSTGNSLDFPNIIKNPKTNRFSLILISIIILVLSILAFIMINKKEYAKFMILIIGMTFITPIGIYALCKCDIKIISNIKIERTPAVQPLYVYGPEGLKMGEHVSVIKLDSAGIVNKYGANTYNKFGETVYTVKEMFATTDRNTLMDDYYYPTFLGYKIEDETITGISIEYRYNNHDYSLVYGEYESNIQTLSDTFASENICFFNNYSGYICSDASGSTEGDVFTNGYITMSINHYGCFVYANGTTYCGVSGM